MLFLLREDDDGNSVWKLWCFELMWTQYGGSGLGLSYRDTEELDFQEAADLFERLIQRRSDEAKALESASKKPAPT